eukprot:2740556-Pyramimonas_sp.AAC.1
MTTSRTLSAGVSSGCPSPLRRACLSAEEAWPGRSRDWRCFIPGVSCDACNCLSLGSKPLGAGEAPRGCTDWWV